MGTHPSFTHPQHIPLFTHLDPSTPACSHIPSTPSTPPSGGPSVLQLRINQLIRLCGLTTVRPVAIDLWLDGAPRAGAAEIIDSLRARVRQRARSTANPDKVGTALERLYSFVKVTGRLPFIRLRFAGDIENATYNSETLEMVAEHMRITGSIQPGKLGQPIASDTVDGYISTIKTVANFEAHCQLTISAVNTVAPSASKAARIDQGPPGARTLKRGLRAQHFRRLIALGYDRSSARGMIEWCAALVAWNLILRGGELGVVPSKAFDPMRDASFGCIEFKEPCHDSRGLPWLTWDTVPIKDVNARRRVCPMAVQRRHSGPLGSDPMCVFDAIVIAWQAASGSTPPRVGRVTGPLASRPFFLSARRHQPVWNTNDTRALAQKMAIALGEDPSEFGGKSFRIGGATDWREVFGADAERIITQRGRWHSDIATLYQRALVEAHLRGSAAVGDTHGADLESLCKGWAQPATFR